ncbi:hypothetical protein [Marinoscillum sp. MHG1-6]|uniref:hypothetical protein n=1 Tax=Marinoscillum sp. MHG1-6 TaxID=2959627 RepID=UPI0021585553|nr:hypothetical protein [Marinoscillum sp. MHG1-6]
MHNRDNRTIGKVIIGDGRPLLIFTGLILILSGLLVIAQSLSGHFLPHDTEFIGLSASELWKYNEGRINLFMFHDRVAFGGSIIAVGALYMWLTEFPLRNGEPWAWFLLLISGIVGFGSFLTYLGYGYLDSWHGLSTLLLLPFFILGMVRSYTLLDNKSFKDLLGQSEKINLKTRYGLGKALLLFTSLGLVAGGLTIMTVGMTTVFVPQDLAFMKITVCGLDEVNENLIPLIAHDRASFGGGVATIGLLFFFSIRRAKATINLRQIVFIAMTAGFGCAVGVHFVVGYTDLIHLLPAYAGMVICYLGLILWRKNDSNGQ